MEGQAMPLWLGLPEADKVDALGELRLDLNFSHVDSNRTALEEALRTDLAVAVNMPEDKIVIEGLASGSIIVSFRIKDATIDQVAALQALCQGSGSPKWYCPCQPFAAVTRTVGEPVEVMGCRTRSADLLPGAKDPLASDFSVAGLVTKAYVRLKMNARTHRGLVI